ncbi:variant erythrocyte surface antigen-1 family protein [Babesia caballi]|uniref:Variant erythrocyte surface antigen-1 family protein n=1 Tax=Babesia caballi TaxID=5871 RepID=A0AAV4LYF0_BABCB|nr:variant erythrocyte surface antigen-1 family protein [Babesia caballi]
MGEQSLTTPPKDLKEAVDWITWVCQYGKGSKDYTFQLAAALNTLPEFAEAKEKALGHDKDPTGFINKLGKGLGEGFLGYSAQAVDDFSGSGIVQNDQGYKSTYANAPWPKDNFQQKQCALIFLGCAVTVYYCMSYVFWRCSENHGKGDWIGQSINDSSQALGRYMEAMGYQRSYLVTSQMGSTVATNLEKEPNGFTELENPGRQNRYSDFLHKLETYNPSDALNLPLASCFKLATEYFNSQKKNANEVTQAIDHLRTKFENHSITNESSRIGYLAEYPYDALKVPIKNLLEQVANFLPNDSEKLGQGVHHAAGQDGKEGEKIGQGVHHGVNQTGQAGAPPSQSSSAGPVAGTLTTLGLGGGAAAAYILNLGGAKTVVNGLLKIG